MKTNNKKLAVIEKIITNNTENWQPRGKMNSCFIIEDKEPFLWRINPKWAEEVAEKILDFLKEI